MPPILVPSSAKRIAAQMLVTEELNGRKDFILRGFACDIILPNKELPVQKSYPSKGIRCGNCSGLRIKTIA